MSYLQGPLKDFEIGGVRNFLAGDRDKFLKEIPLKCDFVLGTLSSDLPI